MKQKMKFKTNLNCGHCVARVKPFLDNMEGVGIWNIDTESEDKILTVESSGVTPGQIKDVIEKLGFDIEEI